MLWDSNYINVGFNTCSDCQSDTKLYILWSTLNVVGISVYIMFSILKSVSIVKGRIHAIALRYLGFISIGNSET